MTGRSRFALVWLNVRRAPRQFLLSAFGIAVGIGSLCFFLALSSGVRRVVLGKVFRVDRIEVEPARSSFDLSLGLLGGPRPLTDDTVASLRAIPGVRAVAPRMRIAFPAKAWGGAQIFGGNRYAEVLGEGLDPSALDGEHFGPEPFADLDAGPGGATGATCNADPECTVSGEYCAWDIHRCLKPTPAVISRFLLELYNSAFAPSHNLPRINDLLLSRFAGFTFTIELGSSFVGPRAARGVPRQRRVMLVGVSDRAVPLGLSFPLPYVRRWNAEYAGDAAGKGYTSITVEVADKEAVTRVAAQARALGLSVVDSGAEQAGLAITLITLLFGLVSLAILAVATINIAHTFFRAVAERRREIGVLRSIGAAERDISGLLLGEAAAVGLVGGLVGIALAFGAAMAVDFASRRLVPDFPFKPDSYFHFTPAMVGAVLAFAVVSCVAGAILPARTAARVEPAEALSSV